MIKMMKLKFRHIFSSNKVQAYFIFSVVANALIVLMLTAFNEQYELVSYYKYFLLFLNNTRTIQTGAYINGYIPELTVILLFIIISSIMIVNNREIRQLNKVLASRLSSKQIMLASIIVDVIMVFIFVFTFYIINILMLWFMVPSLGSISLGIDNSIIGKYDLILTSMTNSNTLLFVFVNTIGKTLTLACIIYFVYTMAFISRNNKFTKVALAIIPFMFLFHSRAVYDAYMSLTQTLPSTLITSIVLLASSIIALWAYENYIKKIKKEGYYCYWDYKLD